MTTLKVIANERTENKYSLELSPRKSISDPIKIGLEYCKKYDLQPENVCVVRVLNSNTTSKNIDCLEYKNQLIAVYQINSSGVYLTNLEKPINVDESDQIIRISLTDEIIDYPNGKNRNVLDDANIDYYLDVDDDDI